MVVLSILMQKKYRFAKKKKKSFSGYSPVGLLFTNEEQEKVARGVIHTSAIYVGLVHDVTHTGCMIQNGSDPKREYFYNI